MAALTVLLSACFDDPDVGLQSVTAAPEGIMPTGLMIKDNATGPAARGQFALMSMGQLKKALQD
jgi:hypothetical protein|tara:strand:- start:234 stop:425 length:192 start_codon:yes stop_codon:yes gene_type:complete